MCGIAGIFAYHYAAPKVDREELVRIRDRMMARGPDGEGAWFSEDGRVGLGHRRLSIIDLSEKGAQPMKSEDGSLVISFNGEIYNYKELRSGLEKKGRRFQSNSDTEVLLHLYAEKGEAMVHDLRGMFAFVLWDAKKRALWMVRDPYGIKPLYYANDGWTLRAASQVKALLESPKVSKDPEPAGTVGFFLWGNVPEPFTTYQEIRSVPAGSYLWVDELGVSKPVRYFSIAKIYADAQNPVILSEASARGRIRPTLFGGKDLRDSSASGLRMTRERGLNLIRSAIRESVRYHLVSDVPVGLFLSSGIDSAMIAGVAHDLGVRDLECLTLGFEEFKGRETDETVFARRLSRHYDLKHRVYYVSRQEFSEELPKIMEAMDQPSIDGVNTYFISKAAKSFGMKVALSGLGGDELFGGYASFREIPWLVNTAGLVSKIPFTGILFRHFVKFLAERVGAYCSPNSVGRIRPPADNTPLLRIHPKTAGLLEFSGDYGKAYFLKRSLFLPWELPSILDRDFVREGLRRLGWLQGCRGEPTCSPTKKTGRHTGLPLQSFAKIATLESSLYMRNQLLRDADWAGMAHSLEIRVPLVDSKLLAQLAPVTGTCRAFQNKKVLANVPSLSIPEVVMDRRKTGFMLPMEEWVKDQKQWSREWAKRLAQESIDHSPQSIVRKDVKKDKQDVQV